MKLNILHLFDSLFPGGAQKIVVKYINNLPEFNHHAVYLAKDEQLKKDINAHCEYIPQKKGLGIIITVYNIYRYCKKNKIDVISCSIYNAQIIGRLVAMLLPKIKCVTTYQGTPYMDYIPRAKFLARIDRLTQRKRFYYIAVSNAVKEHIYEKVSSRYPITVIYNCADKYYYENTVKPIYTSKEVLKFVFIGNNFVEKNIGYLVNLFRKLDPKNFELHVMGGMMEPYIKDIEDNKTTNIFFHGMQKITKELLLSYDIYIASGVGEGSPLATIEAMALGLPTALANTGAYMEVAGNVGYFFNPYNLESGITVLTELYNNQDKLQGISNHHFEFSRNFTEEILTDKMRNYFNQLK